MSDTGGGDQRVTRESLLAGFHADVVSEMLRRLAAAGYRDLPSGFRDTTLCYHNVLVRRIPPRPRVFQQADTFVCPVHLQRGLEAFAARVRTGKSLVPHQSRTLQSTRFQDKMLIHWGIHHFHLGLRRTGESHVARTKELLFAIVTEEEVCGLSVANHGDWYERELLETAHGNWPQHLAHRRLEGIKGSTLTAGEIKVLRDKNTNCVVELSDGTVYTSPFGPVVGSGDTMNAILWAGALSHELGNIAESCLQHLPNELPSRRPRLEIVNDRGRIQVTETLVLETDYPIIPQL